jgi:hypothetical protein
VTATICFSSGQLISSAIALWNEVCIPEAWHVALMYWAVLFVASFTNILAVKYLNFIHTICIFWTDASVVIILVTVLIKTKARRGSVLYVFTEFDASRASWAFFL